MLQRWGILLASVIITTDISAKPLIVSRNDDLAGSAPAVAWESTGCWIRGGSCFVTGYSTLIDSLGNVKGKEAETKFAEDDARQRLVLFIAHDQDPGFDEEAYSVVADIKGMQPAAVFRIEGKEGLFYLGVVKRDSLVVTSSFDEMKAKQNARTAFDTKDFDTAARLYDLLIKHDVQDPETTDYAKASAALLNIAAGIKGNARLKALREAAGFYEKHSDPEDALQLYYQVYQEVQNPDRELLEKLAALSSQTYREDNAKAFRKEIEKTWPSILQ